VKHEHFSLSVDGYRGDASELPAQWHRIVISIKAEIGLLVGRRRRADQFLPKAKVDAIFQQYAFARRPTLLICGEQRHREKHEG
jgi:hypothetical protein